jgi:protein disulfide-isomerase
MKQFLGLIALVLCMLAAGNPVLADQWEEDYEKAAKKAEQEKKLMLLDFTGSDWCGWCIKLDKEVFSKNEFKKYAKENLILVKIDFPRGKSQTAALKKQNQELAAKYNIQGYPTVIVLDASGQKVGELGYMEGGPQAFIAELEKLKK